MPSSRCYAYEIHQCQTCFAARADPVMYTPARVAVEVIRADATILTRIRAALVFVYRAKKITHFACIIEQTR